MGRKSMLALIWLKKTRRGRESSWMMSDAPVPMMALHSTFVEENHKAFLSVDMMALAT